MSLRPLARIVLLIVAAALLTPAAGAEAQPAAGQPQDSGWWAGVGSGYLGSGARCTNCESDSPPKNDVAFLVQGGWRVNPRLVVGGELFTTARLVDDVDFRDTHLIAIAQYRPFARHGFFIKGGYGIALVKASVPTDTGTVAARTWGMGVMYGAGWVFDVSRRVSLAPMAGTYVTTVGDVVVGQATAENVVVNSWFAGAVVMFR
jgi:hypothetical protein